MSHGGFEKPPRASLSLGGREAAEVDVRLEGDNEDDDERLKADPAATPNFAFSWRKLWKFAGPGWLMSLAYLDPGNLESDLQQGAYTGPNLIWVLFWATVMGFILQEMAARIGIVTGRDVAQMVRAEYPRWLNYIIYVMMEIAVVGADIQEVVGSAIALNLLSRGYVRVWVGCIITGLDTFTFLAVQYFGVRYLEAFVTLLISIMAVCFFINWAEADADGAATVEHLLIPSMQSYAVTQAVGTIGAVIMPHNLYLHSGLVLSRKINVESPTRVYEAIWYMRIESAIALLFSFFVNLAVVATNQAHFFAPSCAELSEGPFACMSAATFNQSGNAGSPVPGVGSACNLTSSHAPGMCGELGLMSEGFALHDALGPSSLYIWALGLFAAGQASTMVCTYAGQIIMGGTLEIHLSPWKQQLLTRVFALGPALLVAASTVSDQTLFNNINQYLNILQSVQLPFAMLPVLHFAASKRIMGRFRSSPLAMLGAIGLGLLVFAVNILLVVQFMGAEDYGAATTAGLVIYAIFYVGVCLRCVSDDLIAMGCAVAHLCGVRSRVTTPALLDESTSPMRSCREPSSAP